MQSGPPGEDILRDPGSPFSTHSFSRNSPMSAASLGPTRTFQPVTSSNPAERGAAYPGMMRIRCFTCPATWNRSIDSFTSRSENFPAATAVSTENPSVSTMRRWQGIRVASRYLRRVK